MPRWAVPAAQHGNRLTLWLQRAAVFWRSELLLGAALVKNKKKLLRKVGGWVGGGGACAHTYGEYVGWVDGVVGVPARMHACMHAWDVWGVWVAGCVRWMCAGVRGWVCESSLLFSVVF